MITQEDIKNKYPEIFVGFECNSGWNQIIEDVFSLVQNRIASRKLEGFKFVQIKEKFGGLRMYFDNGDEYISGAVRMAESLSYRTCEMTGYPGEICKKGGWLKTLCPEQAALLGFVPTRGG